MELHRRVAHFVELSDLSQAEIAARVGVTASAVSRWVTGDCDPTVENLGKLVEALGIDMAVFWGPIDLAPTAPAQE